MVTRPADQASHDDVLIMVGGGVAARAGAVTAQKTTHIATYTKIELAVEDPGDRVMFSLRGVAYGDGITVVVRQDFPYHLLAWLLVPCWIVTVLALERQPVALLSGLAAPAGVVGLVIVAVAANTAIMD